MMALGNEELSFEDLIGGNFELAKRNADFPFEIHYDNDGQAIIDIKNKDEWTRGAQKTLNLRYEDKNYTKNELLQWLDKRLRFTILKQVDKIKFLDKAIQNLLKDRTLSELSVNRFALADRLTDIINGILEKQAKELFNELLKKKKIITKPFEAFPDTITLKQAVPQEFNKNYYERIDKLNREELNFVQRLDLDTLPNIDYWVRNREKIDPFYIQGWKKNKFYPDFVAVTKKGVVVALEWKGEDRISNEDTEYKTEIGELWAKLGGAKTRFFLVHNGNIEDVLNHLKNI